MKNCVFFFHSYVAVYQRVTGKLEFRMIRGYIMCIYSWTGLQISDLRLWVQFSASTGKTHILWVQLPFPWVTPFFVGNSLVSLHSSTNWIKKKDVFSATVQFCFHSRQPGSIWKL